jgi:hypothetical protein
VSLRNEIDNGRWTTFGKMRERTWFNVGSRTGTSAEVDGVDGGGGNEESEMDKGRIGGVRE